MLQDIRNTFVIRLLWGFMCVFLFNSSVDIPDKRINQYTVDLSYNDQESILEIFVEKVLGYGNIIAEHEDSDGNEQSKTKKSVSIDTCVLPNFQNENLPKSIQSIKEMTALQDQHLNAPFFEIHSPPPEA